MATRERRKGAEGTPDGQPPAATDPETGKETIWEEKVPDADYLAGPEA